MVKSDFCLYKVKDFFLPEVFEIKSVLMLFEIAVLLFCSVYNSKIGHLLIYRPFLELLSPICFLKIVEMNVINTIRI